MWLALDVFLTSLHLAVVLFFLAGWIVPQWRRAHLILVFLTLFSWFVLGARYGWGYCFLTDWTWRVKQFRGVTDLPHSFIKWVLDSVTEMDWNARWVDALTLGSALIVSGISIRFEIRSRRNDS